MTLHQFRHFSEPHHQALEMQCAKALERGDLPTAYRLSDRRCRIRPLPDSHCYVLRAETLHRMGERAAAVDDLATAIQIAPDDLAANRRMLAWGKPKQQIAAAKALIDSERDPRILRQAIAVLRKNGQTAFAAMQVRENTIEGWVAWDGAGQICLSIAGEADCVEMLLDPDAAHPLSAELGAAVGFQLPRKRAMQFISLLNGSEILVTARTTRRDSAPAAFKTAGPLVDDVASVTVIVPVYGDYRATKNCLESLLGQLEGTGRHQVVIVDDASPDPRIPKLLAGLARSNHVRVLTNTRNLGFVGAVNRALEEVSSGDVVLLNADTVLPGDFIERLSSAAHSAPDIGTVTPLSNNGEFTSFPIPNRPNAVGDLREIESIDRIAARVNAGAVEDIPNGIGFCLYITRSCLDAVGFLSDSYCRGYLEDVDFCLRARQHGFRNVCATSVYVGHVGSRSFGKQKRSLVVRNLKVVEQRFPAYRAECADFIAADPLKAARQTIETCLMASHARGVLLVTCSGAVARVARERGRQLLAEEAASVLIMEVLHRTGQTVLQFRDANDGWPQSLELILTAAVDPTELLQLLRPLELARIEFFDLARVPVGVVDALRSLSVPHDIFIAHTELGLGPGDFQAPANRDALFWRGVVATAGRVLVPDAQAAAVASCLPNVDIVRAMPATTKTRRRFKSLDGTAARLGLIPFRGCAQEHQFMREVIAGLTTTRPELDIIVAGSTHDDLGLMRAGAFVTGAVDPAEFDRLFRRYGLERILLCATRPLFGHPVASTAMAGALPAAYFDWSRGDCPACEEDLPLDSSWSVAAVTELLLLWCEGRKPR